MIWTELAAPRPVFELVSALESGTEFFEAKIDLAIFCRLIRADHPEYSSVYCGAREISLWLIGAP
jgi:hypothetical protein